MSNNKNLLSRLYLDEDIPDGEFFSTSMGEVAVFTRKSPEKSGPNEDTAAIVQTGHDSVVLVVADGVGGQPAGAQASAILVQHIEKICMESIDKGGDLREALLSAIEKANSEILVNANGSATTLAAVEINRDQIRSYHAGDSAVLLCGQKGKLIMETVLHSPTGYAVESGILSEKEAIQHEDRHIVSNVIGTKELHVSMSMPIRMKNFDTLLLATDGLVDNLEKDIIIENIRKGPVGKCGKTLFDITSKRMSHPEGKYKPDDLTFILFRRNR